MTTLKEDLELIEDALAEYQGEYESDEHPARALAAFRRLFRQTWIPCAERLPGDGDPVFFVAEGRAFSGVFEGENGSAHAYFNHLNEARDGYWHARSVSYWMPRFVDEAPDPPPKAAP